MADFATVVACQAEIRTQPKPNCPLCGQVGETLYLHQKDRLFGAPGLWNLKQCLNRECGLIWLDPMPMKEDIGKAYLNYYTHAPATVKPSARSQFRRRFELVYIRSRFGYPSTSRNIWAKFLGFLCYYREGGGSAFVNWKPGGRLLDVGCGAGIYLQFMRALGWEVEGVDFDPAAVETARQTGLNVRCGPLEDQAYPPSSFDVIMMNHVIEHVPDPVASLAECARILKPEGELYLFTPNSSSLTHSIFKECWRGLETPRHLHIFSPTSACRALSMAGFQEITVRPQTASSIIEESVLLRLSDKGSKCADRDSRLVDGFSRIAALFEAGLARLKPSLADCLSAVAVKR